MNDKVRKQSGSSGAKARSAELTCSEGQIEDLLSAGESTENGDELAPVGKAYFGFTDEELVQLDKYVRDHTIERFGPVRSIAASKDEGLVLEVAFEGIQRSPRHRSGVAMRFPRIHRIRWDKPPRDADRMETLEALLAG